MFGQVTVPSKRAFKRPERLAPHSIVAVTTPISFSVSPSGAKTKHRFNLFRLKCLTQDSYRRLTPPVGISCWCLGHKRLSPMSSVRITGRVYGKVSDHSPVRYRS